MNNAARPWDPPLTLRGVAQGTALGERLSSGEVPAPTRIFVSPLGRTVETAAAAARVLGVERLCVEPGLAEVLDEEWYECWRCAPGDARGSLPAGSLFMSAEELRGVSSLVDPSYVPVHGAELLTATHSSPESWTELRERLNTVIRKLAAAHPGETLLFVSHGGPIDAVLPELDSRLPRTRMVDYTSLSALHADAESPSGWTCRLHSCALHIQDLKV